MLHECVNGVPVYCQRILNRQQFGTFYKKLMRFAYYKELPAVTKAN